MRGLRQGDPLSPFLFLICNEGLSTLLRLAREEGSLRGIKARRRSPQITHLLFADDCILFGEASEEGTGSFEQILKEYKSCSGQCVNYGKSTVFFSSNTNDTVKLNISNRLGIKVLTSSEKYLGLPNMVGRGKHQAFQHLKDRIKIKIDSWSTRLLSQGGKEVFIKAILQEIPTYTMGCFLIHWCSWSNLCELKENGGLGYRNLATFNLALLTKQGWRLIENPTSLLAQTLKAKYHPNLDFLNSELGNLPAYAWKKDIWVPNAENLHIQQVVRNQRVTRVADLIGSNNRSWKTELLEHIFSTDDVQKILQISLTTIPHDDFWLGGGSQQLWNSDLPSKILITVWIATLNYLPTLANLGIKRLTNEGICPRCKQGLENMEHIFRDCTVTKEIWNTLRYDWPQDLSHLEFLDWTIEIWSRDSKIYIRVSPRVEQHKADISYIKSVLRAVEAFGARGLEMGKNLGLKYLEIEGDSLAIIKRVKSRNRDKSDSGSLSRYICTYVFVRFSSPCSYREMYSPELNSVHMSL
ncbi:hypothetical protein CXB51_015124 [Gossypium anomalum]|uniref:Reverse transcriptase domain-containing protein n=1 Tax=Gossypium anomalum TaxID=47600 RepID=A0A8J5YKN3_9ROSI|nr:hypothetical protein CXB51_015124 [Gossypium anomalum]